MEGNGEPWKNFEHGRNMEFGLREGLVERLDWGHYFWHVRTLLFSCRFFWPLQGHAGAVVVVSLKLPLLI